MSADKYPSMFSCEMAAIVYILLSLARTGNYRIHADFDRLKSIDRDLDFPAI